ncbi:unnamed protein product [Scytosiphon promiscuus]
MAVSSNVERIKGKPTAVVVRAHAAITTPFTRKLCKNKSARGAKSKQQRQEEEEQEREENLQKEHRSSQQRQQQQQQQRQLPLRYRLLPLIVSSAALQGFSFFFEASTPRGDRVLFALLCFLGAAVAVEACRSAIAFGGVQQRRRRQSSAAAAVNHFRSNASRYMASFLVVVILQAVWSEAQQREDEHQQQQQQQQRHQRQEDARLPYHSALSSLAVLAIAVALQLVAPRLGGFLFRELDDVRPPRLVLLRDGTPPCGPRWAWKTVKGCFVTSVVLGLCIAAAVLSGGGGVLVGLGMTHSVVSAGREALPVIRKGWLRRRMSRRKGTAPAAAPAGAAAADPAAAPPSPPPSGPSFSLESVIASVRAGPTRVICSPVVLPAFLLWVTHSTICSWPKECTDRLALLLRVMATAVCVMHLVRAPAEAESEAATRTGDGDDDGGGEGDVGGSGDGTAWPYKVFVGACSLAAWGFLLLTSLIVLDRHKEDSPEGLVLMLLVATAVALRTPHEKSWRGLMLVFWAALLAVLVNAAASKLMQQNKVFYRIFYSDSGRGAGNGGPVLPSYLRVFRAVAQLRQEGRVALWTVCTSRESSLGDSAHDARQSWFGSWWY